MVSATSGMRDTSALMSTMAVIMDASCGGLRASSGRPVRKPSGAFAGEMAGLLPAERGGLAGQGPSPDEQAHDHPGHEAVDVCDVRGLALAVAQAEPLEDEE